MEKYCAGIFMLETELFCPPRSKTLTEPRIRPPCELQSAVISFGAPIGYGHAAPARSLDLDPPMAQQSPCHISLSWFRLVSTFI